MIFICNAANDITPIFSGNLRQGSINANEILFLAPYAKDGTTVTLRVQLPNGIVIPAESGKAFVFTSIDFPDNMPLNLGALPLNAWKLRVDASITEYAGAVSFQFAIAQTGGDGIPPALYTTTTVVENVPRGVPSFPSYEPSVIDLYGQAVQTLDEVYTISGEVDNLAVEVRAKAEYVEETVGDLNAAFDELHAYAKTIINGGTLQ
jgi:hypothetical protein